MPLFEKKYLAKDAGVTFFIVCVVTLVNLAMQEWLEIETMIPMIFVLGTFLISLFTHGYLWGIAASLIDLFLLNYAFTVPYYVLNFHFQESILCAVVMSVVSLFTSLLMTALKGQERARIDGEKEKMRATLLRAISHDLRTPLTSIYGSASAIIENYDVLNREQQLGLLRDMQTESEWLINMVENLLSVTRIEGDGMALRKTPTVLEELIDSTLHKMQRRYPGIHISVDMPDQFVTIPMDALLIEQVLINLLENAVQHAVGMTKLSLRVTVKGGIATFCVEDDGAGIPKESLGRLFHGQTDVRFRPDRNRYGMGIGLTVCNAIIKAHGGTIGAKNLRGGGARFYFTLHTGDENEQQVQDSCD